MIVERYDHSLASYDITERHESNLARWKANHT